MFNSTSQTARDAHDKKVHEVTSLAYKIDIADINRINQQHQAIIDRLLFKFLLLHQYEQQEYQDIIQHETQTRRLAQALVKSTFYKDTNGNPIRYHDSISNESWFNIFSFLSWQDIYCINTDNHNISLHSVCKLFNTNLVNFVKTNTNDANSENNGFYTAEKFNCCMKFYDTYVTTRVKPFEMRLQCPDGRETRVFIVSHTMTYKARFGGLGVDNAIVMMPNVNKTYSLDWTVPWKRRHLYDNYICSDIIKTINPKFDYNKHKIKTGLGAGEELEISKNSNNRYNININTSGQPNPFSYVRSATYDQLLKNNNKTKNNKYKYKNKSKNKNKNENNMISMIRKKYPGARRGVGANDGELTQFRSVSYESGKNKQKISNWYSRLVDDFVNSFDNSGINKFGIRNKRLRLIDVNLHCLYNYFIYDFETFHIEFNQCSIAQLTSKYSKRHWINGVIEEKTIADDDDDDDNYNYNDVSDTIGSLGRRSSSINNLDKNINKRRSITNSAFNLNFNKSDNINTVEITIDITEDVTQDLQLTPRTAAYTKIHKLMEQKNINLFKHEDKYFCTFYVNTGDIDDNFRYRSNYSHYIRVSENTNIINAYDHDHDGKSDDNSGIDSHNTNNIDSTVINIAPQMFAPFGTFTKHNQKSVHKLELEMEKCFVNIRPIKQFDFNQLYDHWYKSNDKTISLEKELNYLIIDYNYNGEWYCAFLVHPEKTGLINHFYQSVQDMKQLTDGFFGATMIEIHYDVLKYGRLDHRTFRTKIHLDDGIGEKIDYFGNKSTQKQQYRMLETACIRMENTSIGFWKRFIGLKS